MNPLNKILLSAFILLLTTVPALAQQHSEEEVIFNTRNMGGPRFGMTYVLGNGQLAQELEHHNMGRTISQFGWHFEHQVVPEGGGPSFVIEFIPLLAGVEYGKIIPNFSLLMGVRTPAGYEFGMGPNLSFSKTFDDEVEARTSLLLGVGKSVNYGGVSIPLNLAYSFSPEGDRVSVFFGYAIASTKKNRTERIPAEEVKDSNWNAY